jgi:hypothetical protein
MKTLLPLLLLGFGVALAVIIGQRMSTDAMAVVIGVAVGVAASVPTSLLLVALLRRERRSYRDEPPAAPAYPACQQPNFIVLDPAQLMAQRNLQQPQIPPPPILNQDAGMRRLRVVGAEDDWNSNDW